MQEQKRPILSISGKRKPSFMYQKPPQKPDSETVNRTPRTQPEQPEQSEQSEQPEQLTDNDSDSDSGSTGTRKKPNYREPPGWEEVRGKFSDGYFNLGKMLTEIQLMQKKKKSRRDNKP
ncbi:hypothetical protein EAP58_18110 [Salmonella enterica]|nr:hypothetical protein [Salmonella enterica]